MANVGDQPLSLDDFVTTMNLILIEVFALISPHEANEKLIDLATKLNGMAQGVQNPTRNAVLGGLATALMMTEDGG